jgi:hypothetical protein
MRALNSVTASVLTIEKRMVETIRPWLYIQWNMFERCKINGTFLGHRVDRYIILFISLVLSLP